MGIKDLTQAAVTAALDEFDALGRDAFLKRYGFGPARSYFVERGGKRYDSKAIAGAAHAKLPNRSPLKASEFSGGEQTVAAVLGNLGFKVRNIPAGATKSLSDLLTEAGLDPRDVKVFRHSGRGKDLLSIWKNDRAAFETFQSIQKSENRGSFSRPIWASCVALRDGRVVFVGLYRPGVPQPITDGTVDPLTGDKLSSSEFDWYGCEPMSELSEFAGRVLVEWSGSTRSWDRRAEGPLPITILDHEVVDAGSSEPEGPQPRNPSWSRDELILALDFYMRHREHMPSQTSKPIAELSTVLNDLAERTGARDAETFRNPNGVYMKMMNFRRLDPKIAASGGVGLQRGNKDEKVVWDLFADDPDRLAAVAHAIRYQVARPSEAEEEQVAFDEDMVEAPEGKVLTRLHRYKERNRKLVANRKAKTLKESGKLECEVCGFDFEQTYGERGRGFIEAHHTKPVHTLPEEGKTKLEDLALVCSNCHRMIHSSRPWLSLEDLRKTLAVRALRAPE